MDPQQEQQFNQGPEQSAGGQYHDGDNGAGEGSGKRSSKKPLVWTIVVIILIIIAAVLLFYPGSPLKLSGITSGGAVATVNGSAIKRAEFDRRLDQITANIGDQQNVSDEQMDQLKQQLVNSMVNQELLAQAAESAGITVSDEEVNQQVEQTKSQLQEGQTLEAELKKANLTEEEFRANVRQQLLTQKYIDQNTGKSGLEVGDQEIRDFYNQQVGQTQSQEQGTSTDPQVPPLEEVRPQIVQMLKQQKQNEQINQLLEELKAEGDVELHIE